MMAPSVVALVRIIWVVFRHHRRELYWMVADLTLGSNRHEKSLATLEKQTWIGKRIRIWSSPEGRENRVKTQTSRQAPGHHPRLQ